MDGTAERVALAIPEQRRELGLSVHQLARCSGVSRDTITKLERGGRVDPALVVHVAAALMVLELHSEPEPAPPRRILATPGLKRRVLVVPPNGLPVLPSEFEVAS